jgi:hypothetical protein
MRAGKSIFVSPGGITCKVSKVCGTLAKPADLLKFLAQSAARPPALREVRRRYSFS